MLYCHVFRFGNVAFCSQLQIETFTYHFPRLTQWKSSYVTPDPSQFYYYFFKNKCLLLIFQSLSQALLQLRADMVSTAEENVQVQLHLYVSSVNLKDFFL